MLDCMLSDQRFFTAQKMNRVVIWLFDKSVFPPCTHKGGIWLGFCHIPDDLMRADE
jgi:hypothetical protein